MTRETKIGLLVGLAFIVVFAVLLSHTGTVPPPGESPVGAVAVNRSLPSVPVLNIDDPGEIATNPLETNPFGQPAGSAGDTALPVENFVSNTPQPHDPDLPNPGLFEPQRVNSPIEVALGDRPRNGLSDGLSTIIGFTRTAPPHVPDEPQPNARPLGLAGSENPDQARTEIATNDSRTSSETSAEGREYVVQGRDSLYKIAEKFYKSGSPRYINVLVKANELKDANTVREGQKLIIPDLPPDMFEGAKNFDSRLAAGKPREMSIAELERGFKAEKASNQRVAPGAAANPPLVIAEENMIDLRELEKNNAKGSDKSGTSSKTTKDTKSNRSAPPTEDKNGTKESKPSRDMKDNSRNSPKMLAGKGGKDDGRGGELFHWYEIKPKDTLANIARENLGSSDRWKELKKLNNDLDPLKMKPGERIKVPRKPVSISTERGRTSA